MDDWKIKTFVNLNFFRFELALTALSVSSACDVILEEIDDFDAFIIDYRILVLSSEQAHLASCIIVIIIIINIIDLDALECSSV